MSLNTAKGRYKKQRRLKNRFGRPVRIGAPVTRIIRPYGGAVLYGSRWDK